MQVHVEPVYYERGQGLDAIGARSDVGLPRQNTESDHAYRQRLIAKLRWNMGFSETVAIAFSDFEKYKEMFDNQTPCEIDGLKYHVVSVEFETGPVPRAQIRVTPYHPIDNPFDVRIATGALLDLKMLVQADEEPPRDTSVRDAVQKNW